MRQGHSRTTRRLADVCLAGKQTRAAMRQGCYRTTGHPAASIALYPPIREYTRR
jgi:oligoribonuclease NrnB/cAMP/cGMP phosphodiesterase (DHH superfamily)